MDGKSLKFVVIIAGFAVSLGFLIWVGVKDPQGFSYYVSVSEFVAAEEQLEKGFRVNGKVSEGTIVRETTGEDVMFTMTDGSAALQVRYHGIIPDTFVDGADVVVEGRLDPDGVFKAHMLLAKCPSKYESADPPDGSGEAPPTTATLD